MQPSIAMPRLDAGNRIELPNQPAPYGAPDPAIGPILQVSSDLTKDGYGTDPENGPMPIGRRIGIGVAVGICAFGVTWFGSMMALGGQQPTGAAVIALLATAGALYWFWTAAGKTQRTGRCIYLGANGWTRVNLEKGKLETKTMLFTNDMLTRTFAKDQFVNGAYIYSMETVSFTHADGSVGVLVGTYHRAGGPDQHTHLVRSAIKLATARRLPLAQQTLAAGQQIVFALVDDGGRSSGGALVLEQHVLSYFKHHGAQPLVVARNNVYLSLRQGFVDLTMRDSGIVLGTFERESLTNFELLEALVA